MAKRKNRSKRSVSRPPKGVPHKDATESSSNPFESNSHRSSKRPKFQVHNRQTGAPNMKHISGKKQSALAQAIQQRKEMIRADQKANIFRDQRILAGGREDAQLARLVKERSNQSKRTRKFQLDNDEEEAILTHRGKVISSDGGAANDHDDIFLTEQEEHAAVGDLDEADTSLHFGGAESSAYGRTDLSSQYLSRKTELDDLIARRKLMKAEKQKSKGTQVDVFSELDDQFKELSQLLDFRDKEKYERELIQARREGRLQQEDAEMAEWDKEMKQYMNTSQKVQATDRTKTAEEIAQEEADRLHELETRRLARMHGDFENDDLSDVDLKTEAIVHDNAEVKRKSPSVRFTADGLVNVDEDGNVTGKFGDEVESENDEEEQSDSDIKEDKPKKRYKVGTKVLASYRADEQFDGVESWFSGKIVKAHANLFAYDIEYDDGDFEEKVKHEHIQLTEKENQNQPAAPEPKETESFLKKKRALAKQKARSEIPYVFEVPTTMEALNDMIGTYASTGAEASLIIERIHKSNSVRLNKNNNEKMQNFTDVLLRRFIAIGDSLHENGDGGEVSRYSQLDALTVTLYKLSQEAPETTAAVWSRRLGFLQSAHLKRLRDVEFEQEEDFTAWPSTGTILLLKALGHIYPVTDKRHAIVTPALLFICEVVGYTPVLSMNDLVAGLSCCALALEFTKGASRIVPEALAFLSGVIRLFGSTPKTGPLSTLNHAPVLELCSLSGKQRSMAAAPVLVLEREKLKGEDVPVSVLYSCFQLAEACVSNLSGSLLSTQPEAFGCLAQSLLTLRMDSLPSVVRERVRSLIKLLNFDDSRHPLQRRMQAKFQVKSLAPRVESLSMKKATSSTDRMRREYKRERKTVARELKLDASIVESERRETAAQKGDAARTKRHRAHAWLEQEQANLNNQVRQGGGLLTGGGTGAARAKAKTAKLGIKKGGKF